MDETGEDEWIRLSVPDVGAAEMNSVLSAMRSPWLSAGPGREAFEAGFAAYVGRRHAVACSSGTAGLLLTLRALRIGPGDEVIASPCSWHQIAHAIALAGATPVFVDIDYWSGTIAAEKIAGNISERTRAILAGNTNGHPAPWQQLRELASGHGLHLLEDSTEAIGSVYQGRLVGNFGDCAIFDFSQPSALVCGEGAMILTDDPDLASELRYLRSHGLEDRRSVSIGSRIPLQASMSELSAALGLAQLDRIDQILARRKRAEGHYAAHIQSFEGIKPPYKAPEVGEIHWFLYLVHLGTRFTRSAREQIVEDLATERVEAAAYCNPLHRQYSYAAHADGRARLLVAEKIADRALALPFHGQLEDEEIMFIVGTAKDSSVNVGAGAAIY